MVTASCFHVKWLRQSEIIILDEREAILLATPIQYLQDFQSWLFDVWYCVTQRERGVLQTRGGGEGGFIFYFYF